MAQRISYVPSSPTLSFISHIYPATDCVKPSAFVCYCTNFSLFSRFSLFVYHFFAFFSFKRLIIRIETSLDLGQI